MTSTAPAPKRWVGLDAHKYYHVAVDVDAELQITVSQQRGELSRRQDAMVLEMTTNTGNYTTNWRSTPVRSPSSTRPTWR